MILKLYGRTTSYNVQKVLWLLDELNLAFEHIECGGRFGGLDTEEFLAINAFGKVPVLVDNNKSVRESNSILRYLAACYGPPQWWPQDAYQRSCFEAWMDWSIANFETAFVGVFWGHYRMPEAKRNWKNINKSREKCRYCLDMIENQLEQTHFIAGKRISLADICAGVFIYRLTSIDLGITLPRYTGRWYQALSARPGYQTHVMSDFSELKGREDY